MSHSVNKPLATTFDPEVSIISVDDFSFFDGLLEVTLLSSYPSLYFALEAVFEGMYFELPPS